MSLDHAALLQASQKVPSSLPSWLEVGQFVYWKEKNRVVRILGYIGRIVKIDNGGATFSVESEQLAQLEPSTQNTHDLSAISHLPFRELAQQYLDELGQVRLIGATEPDLKPLPGAMHPALQAAFKQVGIEQFYSHQLQAWAELEQGHSLALVTDTASGKSNCFMPMAFQQALRSAKTTLLIYPLKALALDQTEKLVTLNQSLPETLRLKIARCTGDVPLAQRKAYFQGTKCPDVILASPDVLHHLLYRTSSREFELWREFLKRLEMIVIDEAHAYVSSFGIHLANVMRRLRLACDYAGAKEPIKWVTSTATISNPLELASQFSALAPEEIALIERSGARRHERTLLSFKPQAAPNYLVASLVNRLSHLGLKSLVFVNARQSAKALYSLIQVQTKGLANIDIFHGSLLAAKRHNLLERFSRGDLRTLISTNCLECGIDLPALDVVIIRGTSSLNSFWQRAGRCGRSAPGLIIFIPDRSNPIDFYYASDPERFFQQPEKLKINPNYPSILARHLLCAGTEGGLHSTTLRNYFGVKAEVIAAELVRQRQLFLLDNGKLFKRGYPHNDVSLRGSVHDKLELINGETGEVLEELSLSSAHRESHPGAIYLSAENGQMQRWRCLALDEPGRKAELELLLDSDRITRAMVELSVTPINHLDEPKIITTQIEGGNLRLSLWWGRVNQKVLGYSEILQLYAPACSNQFCGRYHQPQSEAQVFCETCSKKLSKKLIDKVIEKISFPESLLSGYDSPILRIEVNQKFASSIHREADICKQRLEAEYEQEELIPSSLVTVKDCNPVHLAMHSLSHALIKAVPLLFLADSNDVNSLIDERDVLGNSNANRFVCYLFDTVDEGCGTTEAIYEDWRATLSKSLELTTGCDCGDLGCPKCLSDHQCPESNRALFKPLGVWLLRQCLEARNDPGGSIGQ